MNPTKVIKKPTERTNLSVNMSKPNESSVRSLMDDSGPESSRQRYISGGREQATHVSDTFVGLEQEDTENDANFSRLEVDRNVSKE